MNFAAVLVVLLCLGACARVPFVARTPSAKISTAGGQSVITQKGDAKTPAAVTVSAEKKTLPLPSGSAFVFDEQARTVTVKLAADSVLTSETRTEKAVAPSSFDPPAPPTASELAQADGVRWFYLAALVGAVVAGLLFWRGHPLAAVKVAAGAVALPVLARFFSSGVAMTIAAALMAAGLAVFVAWHVMRARGALADRT